MQNRGGWSSLGYVAGPQTGRGRAKGGAAGEAGDGAAAARRADGNQPPTILHALLLAVRLGPRARLAAATAAWCRKRQPTFADTLAAVRRQFWREQGFFTSHPAPHAGKLRPALREGIIYALCYAA